MNYKEYFDGIRDNFSEFEKICSERKFTDNIITEILKARIDQQMSQKELATKAGLSFSTINKLEDGDTYPSIRTIDKIFKALDLKIEISNKT